MKKYIAFEIDIPDDITDELECINAVALALRKGFSYFIYINKYDVPIVCLMEHTFTRH